MPEIMLDLETMSSRKDAALCSIGAVLFDPCGDGVLDRFYTVVNLESSVKAGLTMSASTVMWWMQQCQEARDAICADPSLDIRTALVNYSNWLNKPEVRGFKGMWGLGSDFDNVVLRNAYDMLGMQAPWTYKQNQCFRTFRSLFGEGVEKPADIGVAHHALGDAEWQAVYMQKIVREKNLQHLFL